MSTELKILARLLDRMHMFVPKLKGDPTCHYCGNQYEHEVHWREGECSWSAKYRVIYEYLAAFATQVREQSKWVSVAGGEFPAFKERVMAFDGTRILVDYLMDVTNKRWHSGWNMTHWAKLPAPPQTTEQEER